MFHFFSYYQGKLVFGVIIWLIICAVSCSDANKDIEKINEQYSSDYRKTKLRNAPTFGLIIAIIILCIAMILPVK